jgi:Ca2+-binding RTX toxin-like protein
MGSRTGGNAHDVIFGTAGADLLSGMGGNDMLFGGDGADTIIGGADIDILIGFAGADTFIFQRGDGADLIADARIGVDHVRMIGISQREVSFHADEDGNLQAWYGGPDGSAPDHGTITLAGYTLEDVDAMRDLFIFG